LIGCLTIYLLLEQEESAATVRVEQSLPAVDASRVLWASNSTSPFPGVQGSQYVALSEAELLTVDLNASYGSLRSRSAQFGGGLLFSMAFQRARGAREIRAPPSYCARIGLNTTSCDERWQRHVVLFAEKALETGSTWDAGVLSIDGHLTVWANDEEFVHSVPMAINALITKATGQQLDLTAGFVAADNTERQGLTFTEQDMLTYIVPVILVSAAFAFIPAGIMQYMMMEKVGGTKSQLLISGCTYNAYWMSNLLWDGMIGVLVGLLACFIFWACRFDHFINDMGLVVVHLLLFVPGACGLAYVSSQIISSEAVGTTGMLAMNGMIGTLLVLIVIISDMYKTLIVLEVVADDPASLSQRLEQESTIPQLDVVHDVGLAIGMLLPGFSLASGLLRISMRDWVTRRLLPSLVSQFTLDELLGSVRDGLQTGVETASAAQLGNLTGARPFDGAVMQAQDLASEALLGLINSFTDLQPTSEEITRFVVDNVLPPISLSISLQTCYFGSDNVGPPVIGDTELAPVTIRIPCNFMDVDNPNGVGKVVEDIVGLMCAGDSLYHMVVLAVVWPLLAILVETLVQSPGIARTFVPRDAVPEELLDSALDADVESERARVERLRDKKQIILVRNLRRVYKQANAWVVSAFASVIVAETALMLAYLQTIYAILGVNISIGIAALVLSRWWAPLLYWRVKTTTHAVRGVSWASDTGMVFGLLGVNGAGKTSTFEMMSGLLTPSAGEVKVVGMNVLTQVEACRRYIGYCPQFDRIIPRLTPEDHLYMFGRIKGLAGRQLELAVESKLSEMQLQLYRNRWSGTLSGGNKRKLSVAMALIGEPPIVFLDEPSTGMDPVARRFMWKVIDDVAERRKRSVVVLTTHSMEEGEALCSKIAIQVAGQLRCFGSVQQVKSRHGTGYEVEIKFKPVSPQSRQTALETFKAYGLEMAGNTLSRRQLQGGGESIQEKVTRSEHDGAPFAQGATATQLDVFADWWILDDMVQKMKVLLMERSGGSAVIVLEHHGLSSRFRLPQLRDQARLAEIFESLQAEQARDIDNFSVAQSSLEQVFNGFARRAVGVSQLSEPSGLPDFNTLHA